MPRAGHWLEETGGSRSDGSNDIQDLSMMGHVVMGQVTLSHVPPSKWQHPRHLSERKENETQRKKREQNNAKKE